MTTDNGKLSSTMHVAEDSTDARPLPQEYKHAGYTYKQIKRGSKAVMYRATDPESPGYSIIEVFIIKIRPAAVIKGTAIPKREVVPGDGDFGAWAWCFGGYGEANENLAREKFEALESGKIAESSNELGEAEQEEIEETTEDNE